MNISIKKVMIENFKGVSKRTVDFSTKTKISGANGTGKTTIADAVLWLLFNKNSQYVEKFDLRPLDNAGKMIDYVDIKVTVLFDVDGKEIELQKIQKQNWVKKHGSEFPVFQGNVNTYCVDGYPKTEKEYKEVVSGLISEDLFKILTNPIYFPNMKWKDQRDIIMKFAVTESDVDFAKRIGGFDELLDELEKAPSVDDIIKKYAKSKKELDAKLKELPIRIDELSKQKVDYDLSELGLKKKELESKKVDVASSADSLKKEYMDASFELSKYEQTFNADYRAKTDAYLREVNQIKVELSNLETSIGSMKLSVTGNETAIETLEKQRADLAEEYSNAKSVAFDESIYHIGEKDTVCKTCGQKLPENEIQKMIADAMARCDADFKAFTERQKTKMDNAVKRGWEIKNRIDEIKNNLIETKNKIETSEKRITELKNNLKAVESNAPAIANIHEDATYIDLWNKTTGIKAKLDEYERTQFDISSSNTMLDMEISEIDKKIALAMNNSAIDSRIESLVSEQRETSQLIANCEKMIYLVEQFTKKKLEQISATVNSKFSVVKWKLFDVAINGGVVETCELTVDGVPYSSLNHSMQIIAGLDIIDTLSSYYDKEVFAFVDNAECINDFNLPETKGQLIAMYVSEDKELVIE